MTEKQQYIVRIVMDDTTLRKLAWYKWTSLQAVQEEIFIKLADNMVVHSELNLNYDWQNSMPLLKRAMEENHSAFTEESDLVNISLNNIHLKAMVPGNGSVSLIMNKGMVNLHFSAHSIVKLIRFIDDVFPDVELKVKQKALELERDELALSIAGCAIRCKMDKMGLKHNVVETEHVLEIDVLLPPDGRLHFSVKEEEVQEAVNQMEATVHAATRLYALHRFNISIQPLDRWDFWAAPYNLHL